MQLGIESQLGSIDPSQFEIVQDGQGNVLLIPRQEAPERSQTQQAFEAVAPLGEAAIDAGGVLAELAGELSGVKGTADVLQGEGGLLDFVDALGLVGDLATPGIPGRAVLGTLLGGLGLADSVPRLSNKFRNLDELQGAAGHVRDAVQRLMQGEVLASTEPRQLGEQLVELGTDIRALNDTGQVVQTVRTNAEPGGSLFPAGIRATAAREFDTPEVLRILGVFDSEAEIGRHLENRLGLRPIRQLLRLVGQEFPGVEVAEMRRLGGVAARNNQAARKAEERREALDLLGNEFGKDNQLFAAGPPRPLSSPFRGTHRTLQVGRQGERVLQETTPFLDFINTVFANSANIVEAEDTVEILHDLLFRNILSR